MKYNKLMKLFLSFLMVLTITCTNVNIFTEATLGNYDSQVELFAEDSKGENSPLDPFLKQ